MIRYYTNRELSQKLEVNLARWKRWSRSFLPPDPLGGMQSGYARQYLFKDLFKVFLGGHLLSLHKLSLADSQQLLDDLSPWLKRNGFFDWDGTPVAGLKNVCHENNFHIYYCPLQPPVAKNGSGFRYLIRNTVDRQVDESMSRKCVVETYEETLVHVDSGEGSMLLRDPHVRMINLTGLFLLAVEKLYRRQG